MISYDVCNGEALLVAEVRGSSRADEAAWLRAAATAAAAAAAVEVPEATIDWNSLMLIDNPENLVGPKNIYENL